MANLASLLRRVAVRAGGILDVAFVGGESAAIEGDTSLSGRRVVSVLEKLEDIRGLPEVITIDNGRK